MPALLRHSVATGLSLRTCGSSGLNQACLSHSLSSSVSSFQAGDVLLTRRLNHSDGLSRSLEGISGNNQRQIPVGFSGFAFTLTSWADSPPCVSGLLDSRLGMAGVAPWNLTETALGGRAQKSSLLGEPAQSSVTGKEKAARTSRQGSNGEAYPRGNSSRSPGILNLSARPIQLPDFLLPRPSYPLQASLSKPLLPPPLRAVRTRTRGGPELASTLLGPVEAA